MSSLRQIEANRRNSQLSTGHRSSEGKAVSRFNSLKSGINAKAQIIPGEDPAALQAMTDGYRQDWKPATYIERFAACWAEVAALPIPVIGGVDSRRRRAPRCLAAPGPRFRPPLVGRRSARALPRLLPPRVHAGDCGFAR
ncbi:MAG TPA: hypothetical protein VKT49_07975 [Bryobacteraceae bacterium]|nr:hypothetical protein [Bryobacteraceae bacterium]